MKVLVEVGWPPAIHWKWTKDEREAIVHSLLGESDSWAESTGWRDVWRPFRIWLHSLVGPALTRKWTILNARDGTKLCCNFLFVDIQTFLTLFPLDATTTDADPALPLLFTSIGRELNGLKVVAGNAVVNGISCAIRTELLTEPWESRRKRGSGRSSTALKWEAQCYNEKPCTRVSVHVKEHLVN